MTHPPPHPLWKKSDASETLEEKVMRFTVGEDYRWDTLLLPYDIQATRAHAWGLAEIGILTQAEFDAVTEALDALAEQERSVHPEDEDSQHGDRKLPDGSARRHRQENPHGALPERPGARRAAIVSPGRLAGSNETNRGHGSGSCVSGVKREIPGLYPAIRTCSVPCLRR